MPGRTSDSPGRPTAAPGTLRPRRFGALPPAGQPIAQRSHGVRSNQSFEDLPSPTGSYPYRLDLSHVISVDGLRGDEPMVFISVGDTGGIKDPNPQLAVARALEADLRRAGKPAPMFLYHLGDVVYFYGARSEYYPQFYEPYAEFPIPIFAIPGNHDGAVDPSSPAPSLDAFVSNFCATDPQLTPEAEDVDRHAMTQPNVYWTLLTPRATFIGLYTNVPEGGVVRNDQAAWLAEELKAADPKLPVIVALHHPVYSMDSVHGGDPAMQQLLDGAFESSGRVADAVFTGHVHNYQRFTRDHDGRQVPYIVAGAGGYHNLHRVVGDRGSVGTAGGDQVDLVSHCDDQFGFMRISISTAAIEGEYVAVARTGEVTTGFDTWRLDLGTHRLS